MTVYIPQEVMYKNANKVLVPKFNTQAADAFGEIQTLLPYGNVTLAPQPMVSRLRSLLKDFSDDDFILPMGDPIAIAAVIAIAADFNNGKVKILKWRGKQHCYSVLKMNLRGGHYVN